MEILLIVRGPSKAVTVINTLDVWKEIDDQDLAAIVKRAIEAVGDESQGGNGTVA